MTSAGDLSQRRWHGPTLDARTERELIRKAKSGEEPAKQKLLEAFHRFVLPPKQQEMFVRENFSVSATFAELHYSTI
jgi:hypothetical protein